MLSVHNRCAPGSKEEEKKTNSKEPQISTTDTPATNPRPLTPIYSINVCPFHEQPQASPISKQLAVCINQPEQAKTKSAALTPMPELEHTDTHNNIESLVHEILDLQKQKLSNENENEEQQQIPVYVLTLIVVCNN